MRVVTPEEFNAEKPYFQEQIKRGSIFIYPTDTIYGIGCSALLPKPIKKIRKIKGRWDKPFSVIAPSKNWIRENCIVKEEHRKWIDKLPGQYTLILKTNKNCIAKEVNLGLNTLGVRIPYHWSSQFISEIKTPIITTSVNKTGEDFMTSIENVNEDIKNSTDFIIYEGEKKGRPSKIVDLTNEGQLIKR